MSVPPKNIVVGFCYDSKAEYIARGYSENEAAEFDSDTTINAIEAGLVANGYEVRRIGDIQSLVQALARGEKWDIVFNFTEGIAGLARESQTPCLLEAYGIPSTFCDGSAMAACHHKGLTKMVVREEGDVPTANFAMASCCEDLVAMGYLPPREGAAPVPPVTEGRRRRLPHFPMFVKPIAEGSSKGVGTANKAETPEQLLRVCQTVWDRYQQPAIIEDFLPGREMTVGIIGTGYEARVIGVLESVLKQGCETYTRDLKVAQNWADFYEPKLLPATDPLYPAVCDVALRSFRALGCRDLGRVDVRCDANGVPNFLEVNPVPGLAPHWSDLCMIIDQLGMPYEHLIREIMASAVKRIPTTRPVKPRAIAPEALAQARDFLAKHVVVLDQARATGGESN